MRAELEQRGAPGAAIAVIVDGRVQYLHGFGVASIERSEAVTPETLFRIGSVTKAFTGLAALSLRRDGVVHFDAPAGAYLAGLHPPLASRTLQQLLTHTAGVIALPAGHAPSDEGALVRRVRAWSDTVLFAEAGDVFSYSSPGYWLAGAVLEQAAGLPFAEVVRTRVLEPLQLRRSTFRPLVAFTHPVALDHVRADDSVVVARPFPDDPGSWPGGSLFSSAAELARFALALLDSGRVGGVEAIPPDIVRHMLAGQVTAPDGECAYAYGLSVCGSGAQRMATHYGFRSGTGAVFTLLPERRAAVIILANVAGGIFTQTENTVLSMLRPPPPPPAAPRLRLPTAREAARIAGRYASGTAVLELVVQAGRLLLRAGGSEQQVRLDRADPAHLYLVDEAGAVVGELRLAAGMRTGRLFLHDGLNAFGR